MGGKKTLIYQYHIFHNFGQTAIKKCLLSGGEKVTHILFVAMWAFWPSIAETAQSVCSSGYVENSVKELQHDKKNMWF